MRRHAYVLLLAALLGCHTERIVESALVCPCVRFNLVAINGNPMPYTPPSGFTTNQNALLDDYLLFENDGHVTQTSTLRLVANGDTNLTVKRVVGRYQTSLPLVRIAWPQAGNFTYSLRNDTLVIGIKVPPYHEDWTYVWQHEP
jgi:hypothetical protein